MFRSMRSKSFTNRVFTQRVTASRITWIRALTIMCDGSFARCRKPQIAKCKPWMLITLLWSPSTNDLGVEAFLMKRARINGKPILGLESFREHADVLAGMSDKQAELVLLETFIPQAPGTDLHTKILAAWRRGDADAVADLSHKMEHDLPTFAGRLVVERNRNWIPKIEHFIRDRHTYFVVAGAATWAGRMAFSDCCAPAVIRSSSCRASVSEYGLWRCHLFIIRFTFSHETPSKPKPGLPGSRKLPARV